MKPLFRILLAAAAGLAMGWVIRHFTGGAPPAAVARPQPVPSGGPSPPTAPAWSRWLEDQVPLEVLTQAEAFWQHLPPVGSRSKIEWELTLDAALHQLPPEVFLTVLTDERFARLPRGREVETPTEWSRRLIKMGIDEALAMMGRMPTAGLNAHLAYVIRETLAKQDPMRGYEWLKQTKGADQWELSEYLEQVARHDVDKAAAMFATLAPSSRWHGSFNILKTLGAQDWRKAETWGKAHLSPEEWQEQAQHVFSGFSGPRLAELKAIGDTITDPVLKSAAYSRFVFWPVAGSGETLDRALSLPPGSLLAGGWSVVGETCAMRELRQPDPAASAETIRRLALKVPEANREDFMRGTILMAVGNGPLGSQFYDLLKPEETGKLAANWSKEDPAAASTWLNTLPPSEKREIAVLAFCREAVSVDPAGAAAWALTLADSTQRENALNGALSAWRQKDPAAATAWAEAHPSAGTPP